MSDERFGDPCEDGQGEPSAVDLAEVDWVADPLRQGWPESAGFGEACLEAGRTALHLARLRQEAASGWWPQPVPDYLRSLAATARVPLDRVLAWAGIPSDFEPGRAFAAGWGRLARVLEIADRQALVAYRLILARALGLEPPALMAAARPSAAESRPSIEDWDRELLRILRAAAPEVATSLAADERVLLAAYRAEPATGTYGS